MRLLNLLNLLMGLAALVFLPAAANALQSGWNSGEGRVETSLVANVSAVAPGEDFRIGVHQLIEEDWHTYWRNPGDAGLPIEIEWTLPDGVEIGEIAWPEPELLPLGPIMDFGYKDEVVLSMPVSVPADFDAETLRLEGFATWLVCKEICLPEEGEISIEIPIAAESARDPYGAQLIWNSMESVPRLDADVEARLAQSGEDLILSLRGGPFGGEGEGRDFFYLPFVQGVIEHAAEQRSRMVDGWRVIEIDGGYRAADAVSGQGDGLISAEWRGENGWERRRFEIDVQAGDPLGLAASGGGGAGAASSTAAGGGAPTGLATLFLLAFAGGLILNLMPCVFPVLSIKALSFVEASRSDPAEVRRHGLIFLAGVVVSFVLLAALLVFLREFGLPVGWGFQLQTPIVVAALTLLFFVIGLNLLGAFEIGASLMGVGGSLAERKGASGAFFTGVLAVVVAAPCVGPFAAAALGLALTQPALIVLAVSAAMGVGLAAPFVILAMSPALMRFLPKPGAWMETFKQALAFPMFLSALWLLWVLAEQTGSTGVLLTGLGAVAIAFAVWAGKRWSTVGRALALLSLAGAAAATLSVARLEPLTVQAEAAGVEAWSRARVAELRAEGRPVFIDVTAAWCVTCQFNKRTTLNSASVRDAMLDNDVAFLRADWTNRNDEIRQLIEENGQAGVPVYIVYPADGGPAWTLPSLLTPALVVDALEEAAG